MSEHDVEAELAAIRAGIPEPGAAQLERLHDLLVMRAEGKGLVDVAYCLVDSPVGRLLLAASGEGLCRIAFEAEGFDAVLDEIAEELSPRILLAPARLDEAASQLAEYFAGRRRRFSLPIDLRLSKGFRRIVLGHLPSIAYGSTQSYGEIATAVEHPRAARAVGTACATNPVPLVIPCHRVVRSDGDLGSYLGGAAMKRWLLELESAA